MHQNGKDGGNNAPQSCSFVHLADHYYLSLHDPVQTQKLARHEFVANRNFVVVPCHSATANADTTGEEIASCSLKEIHSFLIANARLERVSDRRMIVFCTDPSPVNVSRTSLLIGSYLIIYHDMDVDASCEALRNLTQVMAVHSASSCLFIESCWRAVQRCRNIWWPNIRASISPDLEFDFDNVEIDEYLHYST